MVDAAKDVEILRAELFLRCGTFSSDSDNDCLACEKRQPCIHYETKYLCDYILSLEEIKCLQIT